MTGDPAHLARARQIMIWTIQNLWDASGGAFFDSRPNPDAAGLLAVPHKPVLDTPASSGNAVAAQVLNRLYYLTQESRFRDFARVTIETFAGRARDEGTFMAALGIAAREYLEYPATAVVIGKAGDPVGRIAASGRAIGIPPRQDRHPHRAGPRRSPAVAGRRASRAGRHRAGALAAGVRLLGHGLLAADRLTCRCHDAGEELRPMT